MRKKNLKVVKNNQNFVLKKSCISKISKTFDCFGEKSKKKIIFFLVLLYGITQNTKVSFQLWSANLVLAQMFGFACLNPKCSSYMALTYTFVKNTIMLAQINFMTLTKSSSYSLILL